jgi:transcriptional regulator with XRE-family HTH domain
MAKRKMTRFAGRLRQLREAAGLTQGELAERAGMHRFGVAKLEQGLREPSWATVQVLASALGLDCLAFADSGAGPVAEPAKRGRPRKAAADTLPVPKRRGRPRRT